MSNERDEHDPIEVTGIEKAIDDCTAAVVTELDDGNHDELRASIRVLIEFVRDAQRAKRAADAIAAECEKRGRPTPDQLLNSCKIVDEFRHANYQGMDVDDALHTLITHARPFTETDIEETVSALFDSDQLETCENAMYFFVERFFGKALRQ
jgi:hypothetical protein